MNTYRKPKEPRKVGIFSRIGRFFRIEEDYTEIIHIKYLPQLLFITLLAIIYIGNRHYAERKIRKINQLELKVEELRADYITLKSDYNFASKQSEVARKVAKIELKEIQTPPFKVSAK